MQKHFYVGPVTQVLTLPVMGIANKDLTLQKIWDKFEEHCKPQANELRAHYNLLKKLKQANLSCDQFFAAIQNQLSLCQYQTETHNILKRDIFLFGFSNQTFMSLLMVKKPLIMAAWGKCHCLPLLKYDKNSKKLESGYATAKHITNGGNGNNAGVNQLHGKKQFQGGKKQKHAAITKVTKQVNSPPIHHSNKHNSSNHHKTKEVNSYSNGKTKTKTSKCKRVNNSKNQTTSTKN